LKALVVGGTRYFGLRLVRALAAGGHEVAVLSRGSRRAALERELGGVEWLSADRRSPAEMRASLGGRRWDAVFDQVCFDAAEAELACELFRGRAARYVFASSQSVYGEGAGLREEDFAAERHASSGTATREGDYPEAKRQAEAVFAARASFPVVRARLPIVLGEDDYTGRLRFHVERALRGEPVAFPSLDARVSFIHAQDAAELLLAAARTDYAGPLNVAAREPLRLSRLRELVEAGTGRPLLLASEADGGAPSPFGAEADWWMDVSRLESVGLRARSIEAWLPGLVASDARALRAAC
jgi:nucleoside-diphosphate-sugar epimerase